MTYRRHKYNEILHRAGDHYSEEKPEETGEKTELRGQDRSDKRACARYRGKMMSEQNPLVHRVVVVPVVQPVRRRFARIVQDSDLRGYEAVIEFVGNRKDS